MLKTIYNPQTRTWHGPDYEVNKLDKSVGEVLLGDLEKSPNKIIQVIYYHSNLIVVNFPGILKFIEI